MSAELTLGAEEELHLIDLELWELSARAPQLLSRLPKDFYAAEIQRTTVETNTPVVRSLADFREVLVRLRKGVIDVAAQEGLGIAAVGTAALSTHADFELTSTGRFTKMQEEYRLLVDEQLICGTQVHVGVSDRDLAVQIIQRIAPDLPVLLALSASSPYWNGLDTGYASIRTIIWQRWPTAGSAGPISSAAEYDDLVDGLIRSGVIGDAKMVYFDVRPSSHAPTLELRVCDACPLVDDVVLLAGIFRGMVRAAELAIEAGTPFTAPPAPLHRAAIWQAARSGLSRSLVHGGTRPTPRPAAEVVRDLVARLRPQLEELGDWETVTDLAETVLARGNSADRQRAAYAERGRLEDVMKLVVAETHGQTGDDIQSQPALRRYRLRAGDEAVGPGSVARPAYRDMVSALVAQGPAELSERISARDSWVAREDLTYVVDGDHQPLEVDLFPRILGPHEWAELESGLTQRAWAIESFIRDVYGEQRILRDGVLPRDVVQRSPGWRAEATRLPEGVVRAPVMGFDLVRNEYGGWRVLEDNVRSPSGVAYAIAVRALMDDVMPELPRPAGIAHPAVGYELLRSTLLAHAEPGTRAALLSSGPASSAWFEHHRLADGAGLTLVLPEEVVIADGMLVHGKAGTPIGVLYLRLGGELVDLRDDSGREIGAEIMDVAANGGVVLANAPGNGVADDKSTYPFLPELITYYLGERPVVESVPTYRPADATERAGVLGRVGELVTKPVDGFGGAGVLIGPAATAREVAARRAEIATSPGGWVAQEVVALSSLPCLTGGQLEPRRVDLRAFVYLTGPTREDCRLAPLGLTRVAPAGSLIVNSSKGGGVKDTWIMTEPTDEGP